MHHGIHRLTLGRSDLARITRTDVKKLATTTAQRANLAIFVCGGVDLGNPSTDTWVGREIAVQQRLRLKGRNPQFLGQSVRGHAVDDGEVDLFADATQFVGDLLSGDAERGSGGLNTEIDIAVAESGQQARVLAEVGEDAKLTLGHVGLQK